MIVKIFHFLQTVATGGTRVRLTTADIRVPSVSVQSQQDNTGQVYVGNDLVSSTNNMIDLDAIYITHTYLLRRRGKIPPPTKLTYVLLACCTNNRNLPTLCINGITNIVFNHGHTSNIPGLLRISRGSI